MKTAYFDQPAVESFALPACPEEARGDSARPRSWIEAWVEWARRLRDRRQARAVSVRILSSEGISRVQLEQLRTAVCHALPRATTASLYVWKWPHDGLLDVTLCLPRGTCATATFPKALLGRPDCWSEVEAKLRELIQKCLEQASRV